MIHAQYDRIDTQQARINDDQDKCIITYTIFKVYLMMAYFDKQNVQNKI